MSEPLFSSTAKLAKPFVSLMGAIAVLQLAIMGWLLATPSTGEDARIGVIVCGAVFLIAVLILFARTHLKIYPDRVELRTFGIFTSTISTHEIKDASIHPSTGLAAGAGLRIMGSNTTGYLTGGPCIAIKTVDGATTVVSTPRPEEAVRTIKSLAETGSPQLDENQRTNLP